MYVVYVGFYGILTNNESSRRQFIEVVYSGGTASISVTFAGSTRTNRQHHQYVVMLARLYGRPEVIIYSLLKWMCEIPSPRSVDLKTLIEFGMGVGNLVEHMMLTQQHQHISNLMLLQELVHRLPPNLKFFQTQIHSSQLGDIEYIYEALSGQRRNFSD